MNKKYDYLIVGSGLFGATFAYEAKKRGKKCLVIDKRNHIGGNVYTEKVEDINVHKYGAHIFHTNNKVIWDYVNNICPFNRFTNAPLAKVNDRLFNLPFNMNTFYQLWGTKTPEEAKAKIKEQIDEFSVDCPTNLEEQAINLVGIDIYNNFIRDYTSKQWGRDPKELPPFIIRRIPVRFTYDNNYFNDNYQGIPIGGYTKLIENMLEGNDVELGVDFFENKEYYLKLANTVLYTGPLDEFYSYKLGTLEYRSLDFRHEIIDIQDFQGNAVVNYTTNDVKFTRIIEHKHFEYGKQDKTIITREYPAEWTLGKERYYPVNDEKNMDLFKKYRRLAKEEKGFIFGGRLAEYKYYDMHQVIASALELCKKEL